MKRLLTVLGFVIAVAFAAAGDESVLLWLVDDPDIWKYKPEDNVQVKIADLPFVSDTSDPEKTQAAVRVRYGDDYLELGVEGDDARFEAYYMPDDAGGWTAGPAYAYFDGTADASTLFMIEIGEYQDGEWVILAVSSAATREQLSNFITTNPIDDPRYVSWGGGAYYVPEPGSALLLLVGGGLLALRRRRRRA